MDVGVVDFVLGCNVFFDVVGYVGFFVWGEGGVGFGNVFFKIVVGDILEKIKYVRDWD